MSGMCFAREVNPRRVLFTEGSRACDMYTPERHLPTPGKIERGIYVYTNIYMSGSETAGPSPALKSGSPESKV